MSMLLLYFETTLRVEGVRAAGRQCGGDSNCTGAGTTWELLFSFKQRQIRVHLVLPFGVVVAALCSKKRTSLGR